MPVETKAETGVEGSWTNAQDHLIQTQITKGTSVKRLHDDLQNDHHHHVQGLTIAQQCVAQLLCPLTS